MYEKFAYSLRKDPSQFWRMMRKLGSHDSNRRQGIPNKVLDSNGDTVTSSSEVLRVWKSYFENLLNAGQVQHESLPSLPACDSSHDSCELSEPFSKEEIVAALQLCPRS